MSRPRDERGSVTPLVIGFAVVLALGIALVTDATAAYLHRSGLSTLADGAALSGADAGATGRRFSPICGSLPLPSMSASTAAPTVVPSRRSEARTCWRGRKAARIARKTGFSAKGPSIMIRPFDPMA